MKILIALVIKEFLQIKRDFSSVLIAFVLPLMLLLIYMYAVNLDSLKINLGIKVNGQIRGLETLISSFSKNKYINVIFYYDKTKMLNDLKSTKLRGAVIIPDDFLTNLKRQQNGGIKVINGQNWTKSQNTAYIQVITDGSEPNLAKYVYNYVSAVVNLYASKNHYNNQSKIQVESRILFNQESDSHFFILPGSLSITMTLIGMLLTSFVISREWERGTFELLISTHITKLQFILSKTIPYFLLGFISFAFNVFLCIYIFKIPFRGSMFILFCVSSIFLLVCLNIGLIISSSFKNQFTSSQTVMVLGFMPSLMLSGLIYPIFSMPKWIQTISIIIPARYYVSTIQTQFLVGNILSVTLKNTIYLLIFCSILSLVLFKKINLRLDN